MSQVSIYSGIPDPSGHAFSVTMDNEECADHTRHL